MNVFFSTHNHTLDRRQSKTLILSRNVDKIVRNSFRLPLSSDWRQIAIENTVSIEF